MQWLDHCVLHTLIGRYVSGSIMNKLLCQTCNTETLGEVGESSKGVRYFVCSKCRELKRWCPRCDQGWINKFVDPATNEALFNCEECEATWLSVNKIGSLDRSQFDRPFDGSMESFRQVATYET